MKTYRHADSNSPNGNEECERNDERNIPVRRLLEGHWHNEQRSEIQRHWDQTEEGTYPRHRRQYNMHPQCRHEYLCRSVHGMERCCRCGHDEDYGWERDIQSHPEDIHVKSTTDIPWPCYGYGAVIVMKDVVLDIGRCDFDYFFLWRIYCCYYCCGWRNDG